MPELPDVEGFREVLARHGEGHRVERVEVADAGVLRGVSAARLRRELKGRRLGTPTRHGKWLIAPTGGPTLLLHFGMTGRLVHCAAKDEPHPHDRVVVALRGDGQLRFRDQRKLQGIRLEDDAGVRRVLDSQGPDAAEVDRAGFEELVRGRRARVKSVLIDQSALAGLGNLLADEILWRARLHPARRADSLDPDELRRLHGRMRGVLRSAVPTGRVPPRRSWLTGHRDDPDPHCPRCGHPLRRGRVSGRGTVWCPHCQPEDG
ncbi:DNA-formamidopyrimidine glycosylase family protein [Streptantibioticus parmotrematis]|uniref:Fpg/Nei family DNA glycosylase n=1 Tax=Streptantibioticus parmotrematis TaxID=2873249 RepID=UPI003401EEEA